MQGNNKTILVSARGGGPYKSGSLTFLQAVQRRALMKALAKDNELFVHVYMKSSLNAKHNMGKKELAESCNQQQKRLALRADQKQDANSHLEREAKFTCDAGGHGGRTVPQHSLVTSSVCALLFSCFTSRVTLLKFDLCSC